MHLLEVTPYGLNIKLSGVVTVKSLHDLRTHLESKLNLAPLDPKVLFDVTGMRPLTKGAKLTYAQVYKLLLESGMARSCVLYTSPSIQLQLKNICARLEFSEERYIHIRRNPSYKRVSREWLVLGVEIPKESV